ncbi:MAG: methionyl-tRNA formyltransferase [Bacteroidota bacterium]|jgi:methionyl-tRNA formyltransferase
MSHSNLRLLFYGTPDFAAESLQAMFDANFNIVGVITAPDKASGRGMKLQASAVKQLAISLGLPIFQPTNLKSIEFLDSIQQLEADLGVVIAFRMLPESIWNAPKLGTINLHGSLLPKYRGAAPIQHAIIQGEKITGLTVFFLRHEIDTGDILKTEEIAIDDHEDFGSLYNKMKISGSKLIVKAIREISTNNYHLQPQSSAGDPTFAPKITKEFCKLDLTKLCKENFNKIRGLSPHPGAWLEIDDSIIKIYSTVFTEILPINQNDIQIIGKNVYLKCGDGLLEITSMQLAGKPRISGVDYVNGIKNR